jgi:hypothetical protein
MTDVDAAEAAVEVDTGAAAEVGVEIGVVAAAEVETGIGAGAAVAETGIGAGAVDMTATAEQQADSVNELAVGRG